MLLTDELGRSLLCLFAFLSVLGVTVRWKLKEHSSADTQTVVLDIDVSGGTTHHHHPHYHPHTHTQKK